MVLNATFTNELCNIQYVLICIDSLAYLLINKEGKCIIMFQMFQGVIL